MRDRAAEIGERLTSALFSDEARERLRLGVHAGSGGRPAVLHLAVEVTGGAGADLERRADWLLALPWELLRVDGRFPVENNTLDVTREARVRGLEGLGDGPGEPLSIVATVAAPVDGVQLDHEGEMYRLWRALGAGDEQRLIQTDLGTLDDLFEAVKRHRPPVVHFTGHGQPGRLFFEDDRALSCPVEVDGLIAFYAGLAGGLTARAAMRNARAMRLVVSRPKSVLRATGVPRGAQPCSLSSATTAGASTAPPRVTSI